MHACIGHVQLCTTSWTVALKAPLSMGFPRQECWSGLLFPPAGDLPDPGMGYLKLPCFILRSMKILSGFCCSFILYI